MFGRSGEPIQAADGLRMLVCDLDGTLLGPEQDLSPAAAAAVRFLSDRGVRVVLASGRIPAAMATVCRSLGLDGPHIGAHGAVTSYPLSGEVVAKFPLRAEDVRAHLEFARAVDATPILCYPTGFLCEEITSDMPEAFAHYDEPLPDLVPSLAAVADSEPLKTYLWVRAGRYPEVMRGARERFGDRYTVTTGDEEGVEILSRSANKALAARALIERMGLDMSAVAAVGDGPNDVDLLREAGRSAAMQHAGPEVHAAADFVVPTNGEDGAVVAMRRMFSSLPWDGDGRALAGRGHGPGT